VKRFTAVQPYDVVSNALVIPHLFPLNANDTNAYWKGYNWTNAINAGMAAVGKTFSGQLGWANTEMFWIQNHMVAPKEKALVCKDCHAPGGRLQFAALGYDINRTAKLQTLVAFDIRLETQPQGARLSWLGVPGYRYQVQSCTDLTSGSWSGELTGVFVPNTATNLTWAEGVGGAATGKFFRVLRSDAN